MVDSWVQDTLLIGIVSWYVGHGSVIGSIVQSVYTRINLMVKQTVTLSMSSLFNPMLMVAELLRQGMHKPNSKDAQGKPNPVNVVFKKYYYVFKETANLSPEDEIKFIEDCESMCWRMWSVETGLNKKDHADKVNQLITLIRTQYRKDKTLPAWVDSVLANGQLDASETAKNADGKKTNTLASVPTIGKAIEVDNSASNRPNPLPVWVSEAKATESPVKRQTRYTVAGLGMVAGNINAKGQLFTLDTLLEDSPKLCKVGNSFMLDEIAGIKWVISTVSKDTDSIRATWHNMVAPTTTTTAPTTAPTTKGKGKGKVAPTTTAPTTTAPTTSTIEQRMDNMESMFNQIMAQLANKE